jgi:hypothetical protein
VLNNANAGLYLTDLIFIDDGNPDFREGRTRNGDKQQLINFDKYLKTARVIHEIQRFQQPYNLTEVPEIHEFLKEQLNSCRNENQSTLYQQSLEVEPRGSLRVTSDKLEDLLVSASHEDASVASKDSLRSLK